MRRSMSICFNFMFRLLWYFDNFSVFWHKRILIFDPIYDLALNSSVEIVNRIRPKWFHIKRHLNMSLMQLWKEKLGINIYLKNIKNKNKATKIIWNESNTFERYRKPSTNTIKSNTTLVSTSKEYSQLLSASSKSKLIWKPGLP